MKAQRKPRRAAVRKAPAEPRRSLAITPELEAELVERDRATAEKRSAAAQRSAAKRRQKKYSQWFTDEQLARRVVHWTQLIRSSWSDASFPLRVLEPSAGAGGLVSLMPASWRVTSIEIDGALLPQLAEAHKRAGHLEPTIIGDNFTKLEFPADAFDVAIMNPPYERGQWAQHVLHALRFAPRVIAIGPSAGMHGVSNYDALWRSNGVLHRLAPQVRRPRFGGTYNPQRDFSAYDVGRRDADGRKVLTNIDWWF